MAHRRKGVLQHPKAGLRGTPPLQRRGQCPGAGDTCDQGQAQCGQTSCRPSILSPPVFSSLRATKTDEVAGWELRQKLPQKISFPKIQMEKVLALRMEAAGKESLFKILPELDTRSV